MSVSARIKSPVFLSTLFLLLFAALMFRVVWPADQVILSSDYNYGLMGQYKAELPGSFFQGFWRGYPLLGQAGHAAPTWTNLSLSVLPLDFYMDWIYPINLLLASGFLIAFLRLRGCSWLPALGGALSAYWLGSNLTLVYPGHLEKFGVLIFASATLYCLEQLLQKGSWRWSLLAGASLGWMFMHQADLALFFGLVLGAYFLFGWITRFPHPLPKRIGLILPMLLMALLFGWSSYTYAMRTQVKNVTVLQEDNPEGKWNFATQWSFPPNESLDFIAPGYWGWMSQHRDAPYYGRMGQSAEWPEYQKGFPNFKMESVYVGILPVFFALLALFHFRQRRDEKIFWGAVLAVTFLLACGKFTPLYALFFKLPLVNSIRNPNKFIQVFQWSLGILCAFGFQQLLDEGFSPRARKRASLGLILVSLLAGVGSLLVQPGSETQLQTFAGSPWSGQAAGILRNRQLSLLLLSLLAGAGGGLIFVSVSARFRKACLVGLLLLISLDALNLSREYLKPANTRFLKQNKLADFLKENLGAQRVSVIDNNGLYNFYLTHLFPYHHIPFADIAVAPRLQSDYQQYFDAVGQNRIRLWQEFGVKYVLAPRGIYQTLLRNPGMERVLREVYSYDIAEYPSGGLRIVPGKVGESGSHVVLELMLPSERFTLLSKWESAGADAFLTAVRKNEPPFQEARIQTEVKAENNSLPAGKIINVLQKPSGFLLQTEVTADRVLLRLADHYDPQLRARIDGGDPQPLLQTDLLFAGLIVPKGVHEVELTLAAPDAGTLAQWLGLALALGTVLSFLKFPAGQENPEGSPHKKS